MSGDRGVLCADLALPAVSVKQLARGDEGLVEGPKEEHRGGVVAKAKRDKETEGGARRGDQIQRCVRAVKPKECRDLCESAEDLCVRASIERMTPVSARGAVAEAELVSHPSKEGGDREDAVLTEQARRLEEGDGKGDEVDDGKGPHKHLTRQPVSARRGCLRLLPEARPTPSAASPPALHGPCSRSFVLWLGALVCGSLSLEASAAWRLARLALERKEKFPTWR